MLIIDGASGEGGGQILRTALALSLFVLTLGAFVCTDSTNSQPITAQPAVTNVPDELDFRKIVQSAKDKVFPAAPVSAAAQPAYRARSRPLGMTKTLPWYPNWQKAVKAGRFSAMMASQLS